jgi:hypothetical protein
MGGSMTVPAAESIVRSINQVLVRAQVSGQAMAVMHPMEVMMLAAVSKPTTNPGPKLKLIVPIESITEEMLVKNRKLFLAMHIYNHLVANKKLHNVHMPKRRACNGHLEAMTELIHKLKSKIVG